MVSVAIVGLGHVAAHQIEALHQCDGLQFVAGCDLNSDKLRSLPSAARKYERIEDLIEDQGVDVVVVGSPNSMHVEHAQQVLASGKWLVIEKPMAVSRTELHELIEARESSGARCTVALHAAFGVDVDWIRNQIEHGAINRDMIYRVSSGFYDPYFVDGEVLQCALSLSGSWLDSGINALSVVNRILGPTSFTVTDSRMTRVVGSGCSEVQGTVEYCFSHGTSVGTGLIDTNWTIGRDRKFTSLHLRDTNKTIVVDHSEQCVFMVEDGTVDELFRCKNGRARLTNHYIGVFDDLQQQLQQGEDNFDLGLALHDWLYTAEEWAGIPVKSVP